MAATTWTPVRWPLLIVETEGHMRGWLGRDRLTGRSLNALVNTAAGASWILRIHNGGGVVIGYSQHAGTW